MRNRKEKENSRNQKGQIMRTNYRTRAEKLLRRIYPFIKNCNSPEKLRKVIRQYNAEHNARIIVCNGAARCALVYSDYVIKFDYGTAAVWAGGCEEEYTKYHDVIAHSSFRYLFAEIEKVVINRKCFYIMPRVRDVGASHNYWYNLTGEELNFIHSVTSDMHSGNYGHYRRKPKIVDYAMAS